MSSSDRKGKRPADDEINWKKTIDQYFKQSKLKKPSRIPDRHNFESEKYNGYKRYQFSYTLNGYDYYWDTKKGGYIMAKASKSNILKLMAQRKRNKAIMTKYRKRNNKTVRRARRRYKRRRLSKRIRVFGKDKQNKTIIAHKKKLKQTKQIRKLFKAGNTVKRENVINDGQNIVENAGYNKYRYFTFLQMQLSDVYQYFNQWLSPSYGENNLLTSEYLLKNNVLRKTEEAAGAAYGYQVCLNEGKSLYIGKAVYTYEIMNPTNYTMYVDMYDIIAKRDYVNTNPKSFVDYNQQYISNQSQPPTGSSAGAGYPQSNVIEYPDLPYPEACMYYGSHPFTGGRNRVLYPAQDPLEDLSSSYPTGNNIGQMPSLSLGITDAYEGVEISGNQVDNPDGILGTNVQNAGFETKSMRSKWNSFGMGPTSYRLFNTFWKVKKVTRISIEPNSTFKHTVVTKLGQIYDRGSFMYRFPQIEDAESLTNVGILGGITTGVIFRTYGQVNVEATVDDAIVSQKQASTGTIKPGDIQEGSEDKVDVGYTKQTDITQDIPNQQRIDSKGNYAFNNRVFSMPGKLIIKRTRKENIYYGPPGITKFKTITDLQQGIVNSGQIHIITKDKERNIENIQDTAQQNWGN